MPSTLEKIFDAGLPLAVEKGYVEQNGGMIRLDPTGKAFMVSIYGKEPEGGKEIAEATMLMFIYLILEREIEGL